MRAHARPDRADSVWGPAPLYVAYEPAQAFERRAELARERADEPTEAVTERGRRGKSRDRTFALAPPQLLKAEEA